jgi:hypothetical protein
MKNKIYYLGLAALMLLSAGCLFKVMHWPLAGIMITFGILLICIAFIPAAFISSFSAEENKTWKKFYIITAVVLSLDLAGALFKVMHWPGAGMLILISMPLPFILVLPAYILSNRKENEINYRNFLAIVFFFAYFAAISALMALGVSKNVIEGYVRSAINIEQKTDVLSFQCQVWQDKINSTNTINKERLTSFRNIGLQANSVCNKIDCIVKDMIMHQSGLILKDGKPDLWQIKYRDADVGIWIMDDLSKLKSGIIAYKKLLAASVKGTTEVDSQIEVLLHTDGYNEYSWEQKMIKDKILVSEIEQLYLLKHQVRLAEWGALTSMD